MTYAYLQGARDEDARAILLELPKLAAMLKRDDANFFAGAFALAAIPVRNAVERRRWQEAAHLEPASAAFASEGFCGAPAMLEWARGLGAARTGKPEAARRSIERLHQCREDLLRTGQPLWAAQVDVQRRTVAAWLALAEGRQDKALETMRAAADLEDSTDKSPVTPGAVAPAREMLAEMLLNLELPAEALAELERVLEDAPNRLRSLHGAAQAALLAGETQVAKRYFTELLELGRLADSERPELREAGNFLARR